MTKYDLEKSISPQKGKAASVPLFLILICVIFTSSLQAQPVNRWIRFFDGQNDRDEFFDIFATAEGGYAVAGYSYLDRQHNGFSMYCLKFTKLAWFYLQVVGQKCTQFINQKYKIIVIVYWSDFF